MKTLIGSTSLLNSIIIPINVFIGLISPFLFHQEDHSQRVGRKTRRSFSISSQNHRMVGVRRDLCGSPSPTPLPKQGHLQ